MYLRRKSRQYDKRTSLFLSDLNQNWTKSTNFSKNPKYEISRKCVIGVVQVHEERETDITKLTVAFCVQMLLKTVILFGYYASQGLNSEVCQNFGVVELF
jgi:hypothetical protein